MKTAGKWLDMYMARLDQLADREFTGSAHSDTIRENTRESLVGIINEALVTLCEPPPSREDELGEYFTQRMARAHASEVLRLASAALSMTEVHHINTLAFGEKVDRKFRCTAHHEAGHAVAALLLGMKVTRVTVVPHGLFNNVGVSLATGRILVQSETTRSRVWRSMICLHAGPIAESAHSKKGCRSDNDSRVALETARDVFGAECAIGMNVKSYDAARNLVRAHAKAIDNVAAALLARPTITAEEATLAAWPFELKPTLNPLMPTLASVRKKRKATAKG